ncbi:essential MCU regulator, mitochondrial [Drosophila eugracilis]|uniref:essential MCU regulator, mitochondrial n=1 Tax=Drosophila eugracilis TaxID=29029 RepID=UPI0007E66B7F|nr:essential MCU regulator, mitochondrial [Drosophila eugracilis]
MPIGGDDLKDFKELNKIPKRSKTYMYAGIMLTVIPGILLGGYMGKKLAQFLEIFDLYTPDIVDDNEWSNNHGTD